MEELTQLALSLCERLLEPDVDDVRWVRDGRLPEGAKSVDAVAVGALVVSAAPVLWRGVPDLVQAWLQGRPVRGVKVDVEGRSVELTAASREEQRLLVEEFLRSGTPAEAAEAPHGER